MLVRQLWQRFVSADIFPIVIGRGGLEILSNYESQHMTGRLGDGGLVDRNYVDKFSVNDLNGPNE